MTKIKSSDLSTLLICTKLNRLRESQTQNAFKTQMVIKNETTIYKSDEVI